MSGRKLMRDNGRAGALAWLATMLVALGAVVVVPTPAGALTISVGCGADRAVDLINAVDSANNSLAVPDSISLAAACVYSFTASNLPVDADPTRFNWYGPSALPAVSSDITIEGNGAVIERSASATTNFRMVYVGASAATGFNGPGPGILTLHDLTVRNFVAKGGNGGLGGGGGGGMGGAIFNQGTLTTDRVTFSANTAQGGTSTAGTGGGGGGIGTDAPSGTGGGFGPGTFGGSVGGIGGVAGGAGGGGGFGPTANGANAAGNSGGAGGGPSTGTGGTGALPGGIGAQGGDGAGGGGKSSSGGGAGGGFGQGGVVGGGGGVGGGGAAGSAGGGGFGGGGGGYLGGGRGGGGGFGAGGGGGQDLGSGGPAGFGGGVGGRSLGSSSSGGGGGGAGLGGAVFNHQGTLVMVNTTLSANTAMGGLGGAGGSAGSGTAGAAGSDGNGLGGAIFNLNGSVTLTNSTVAANATAVGLGVGGGGIFNTVYDKATARTASVTLVNTIVADSTGGPADLVTNKPPVVADFGTNLGTAPVDATGSNLVESQQIRAVPPSGAPITGSPATADPQLGPLQDNGGPGMATMKPAATSPVVNTGQASGCPAVDQRGTPRPLGLACDMGAVELALSFPALVRVSTTWLLRNALTTGVNTTPPFTYGVTPLVPVTGDWDGNGTETPGIYKGGAFQLSNAATGASPFTLSFGSDPRGFPVVGDFDGDGIDDLAVFRNGTWQWRGSSNGASYSFTFGSGTWPATVPVAGDWDGDGVDGFGTFVGGLWTLIQPGGASAGTFTYTAGANSYPVVGDWDGDGVDTVGVKRGTTWSLRNTNGPGGPDNSFDYGLANDLPLTWR